MTNEKKVYKNPTAGKPLISTISAGCKTPILQVKFSNLINAFYYPNSSIPRFSITCLFDPSKQKEFLKEIQTIIKYILMITFIYTVLPRFLVHVTIPQE